MKYRERLAIDHPSKVGDKYIAGCAGCPGDHYPGGPVEDDEICYDKKDWDCDKCWDQEMPKED